ncbi:MAG: LysR substrate-binding domain-containing protein [Negativicutes bacterium]
MSNLQSLSVFIAVAEEKSFSAAAKKLSLTQPTVSFHIDGMERKLGCPLFARSRRGVELTVYGRTLYENTRNVQEQLDRTERKIHDLCQGVAGRVTIGAGTIPGEYILPSLLAAFLRDHPGVSVNLVARDSRSIYRLWQAGKTPICVVGFLPPAEDQPWQVWSDELIPVVSGRMSEGLPILFAPADLSRYPLVMRQEGSSSRSSVEQALFTMGIRPADCNVVLQVGGNEALKRAVLAGAGIGFVSRRTVENEIATGVLSVIKVAGLSITRHFYALRHPNQELPAAEALWKYIVDKAAAESISSGEN